MNVTIEHIQALIELGQKFTFVNFSSKSEFNNTIAPTGDWLIWIQRVTNVANALGKNSTAASSIRLGLTVGLIGYGESQFQQAKSLILSGLQAALVLAKEAPGALSEQAGVERPSITRGFAFIAMPMDSNDHELADVHDAIKAAAKECGVKAERIDEDERNERITDRMLEAIARAEYVIVDLTNERPNVFYEAGYAHGLGKIPIYVARSGTELHFDVKDYPVISFRNMRELRDGVIKRLKAISSRK